MFVTFVSRVKTGEPIEMPFGGGLLGWAQKEQFIRWRSIYTKGMGQFLEVVGPIEQHEIGEKNQ